MDVVRVPVPVETRSPDGLTNAYVIGRDSALLIDPANRSLELDELVRERDVQHVLATHTHNDHVGALAEYARETDATVWAFGTSLDRFREATGLEADRTLEAGTTISAGNWTVTILETPGHAPDHLSFMLDDGSILCGDCVVAEGSVVVGAPAGDMRDYLDSLNRLRALDPPCLYPGHGPVIDHPVETLDRLISHRLKRERRVLEAVEAGAETIDAILGSAYNKNLDGVRDLARATVVAHLEKLAADGRLEWDGERALPR